MRIPRLASKMLLTLGMGVLVVCFTNNVRVGLDRWLHRVAGLFSRYSRM